MKKHTRVIALGLLIALSITVLVGWRIAARHPATISHPQQTMAPRLSLDHLAVAITLVEDGTQPNNSVSFAFYPRDEEHRTAVTLPDGVSLRCDTVALAPTASTHIYQATLPRKPAHSTYSCLITSQSGTIAIPLTTYDLPRVISPAQGQGLLLNKALGKVPDPTFLLGYQLDAQSGTATRLIITTKDSAGHQVHYVQPFPAPNPLTVRVGGMLDSQSQCSLSIQEDFVTKPDVGGIGPITITTSAIASVPVYVILVAG